VRVIGHRFSKETHDLRDFLARNRVPARWLDIERDTEARELLRVAALADDRLPVALLEDGTVLERPTVRELAERLGVASRPGAEHYDLIIVGGGPAGLAAAVYGASEGLRTVMIEREAPGGQAGQSSRIENYLGFPAGLSGSDLARRATDQARRLGAELLTVSDASALRARTHLRAVLHHQGRRQRHGARTRHLAADRRRSPPRQHQCRVGARAERVPRLAAARCVGRRIGERVGGRVGRRLARAAAATATPGLAAGRSNRPLRTVGM
jgi:hypothetical protein